MNPFTQQDVVDQDKTEITRESVGHLLLDVMTSEYLPRFSLKFQQIVEKEQDANFISRLHAGKLNIIPWWMHFQNISILF